MSLRLLTIGILCAQAAPAWAWNKAGHMVSGAIAFSILKQESPATIGRVIALLKEHPQYESLWAPRLHAIPGLDEEEKEMYLFMQAARWADDARSHDEFHHGQWHFINLPFKPAGQPEWIHPTPPDPDNIIRAYELNLSRLKDRREDAEERAVAACWVFHLIGDAHQPLHTTSLFTTEYPHGDRGANRFYIHAKPGASAITLHQYWDDLIIGSERFQQVRNHATELRLRHDLAKPKLSELKESRFEKWVSAESFHLAKDVVYRDGHLKGGTDRSNAETLPEDYHIAAKATAERRIVLAGYRLAAILHQAMADQK